jgi:hypothetical protein
MEAWELDLDKGVMSTSKIDWASDQLGEKKKPCKKPMMMNSFIDNK